MPNKKTIFIFTKDRIKTLNKTLHAIRNVPYEKYILDDSERLQNQQRVLALCTNYPKCTYLGKLEYEKFTSSQHIDFPKFDFLLREIGCTEWNLGYARNFALLYAKYLGSDKVLFMDDDIEVRSISLIDELFNLLNQYKFVGAKICQMTDHSILEYIAIDLGIKNPIMLSGGFMAFNPETINHYFLNIYNEDWIWLHFQLKNETYFQTGCVFQSSTNPFFKYKQRILFQEFGEIAIDGLLELFNGGSYDLLTEFAFWERIVKMREEFLNELLKKAIIGNNDE